MKTKNAFFLGILLITAQSCTIFSLNPLYHEEDLLAMPEIEGLWQDTDDKESFVSFSDYDDKKYVLRYMEGYQHSTQVDSVSFEAGILKVGDDYFIDLFPYYNDYDQDEEYYLFRNFIPTHSFIKIEWEEEKMVLSGFSYDRLKELFEQNRIRIRHQMFEDYIVITASTDELQKFIEKYADDENVFDEPEKFIKIR